ncbi:DNA repair protein RadC [[Clostridium] innocuum]|nr:DNA repair protein RadC [[Clostridium] innocuum]
MKKRIDIVSLKLCKEKSIMYEPRSITRSEDCIQLIKTMIGDSAREKFIVIALNPKNEPTAIEICSLGTTDMALVHPREVFKTALVSNATKIIIAHNHPSGSVKPSKNDIEITKALVDASAILDIPILDHIIIGDYYYYYSFSEHCLI